MPRAANFAVNFVGRVGMLNLKPEPAVLAVESIEEQGGFHWGAPLGASIVFVVITKN